jgi:hypothetical protein
MAWPAGAANPMRMRAETVFAGGETFAKQAAPRCAVPAGEPGNHQ